MKQHGAHIVIAQTHADVLSMIRFLRDDTSPNVVSYTSNPGDVIELVIHQTVDVVVTGALFYRCGAKTISEKLDMFERVANEGGHVADEYYRPPKSGPREGVQLCELIRAISPDTLLLRFTVLPETHPGNAAGDIPKLRDTDTIVDFVDAPHLAEILRTKDCDGLVKRFPRILFYPNLHLWARSARSWSEVPFSLWPSPVANFEYPLFKVTESGAGLDESHRSGGLVRQLWVPGYSHLMN